MSETAFNPAQLATEEEAREIIKKINDFPIPIGGGAKEFYIPQWLTDAGFEAPSRGDAKYLHLRFNNGAEGVNVGLVREQFKRYPLSPNYVLQCLFYEVQALGRR